jgi:hypothetical protein
LNYKVRGSRSIYILLVFASDPQTTTPDRHIRTILIKVIPPWFLRASEFRASEFGASEFGASGFRDIGRATDIGWATDIGRASDIGRATDIGRASDIGRATDIGRGSAFRRAGNWRAQWRCSEFG